MSFIDSLLGRWYQIREKRSHGRTCSQKQSQPYRSSAALTAILISGADWQSVGGDEFAIHFKTSLLHQYLHDSEAASFRSLRPITD